MSKKLFSINSRGFTLVEILLAIVIFPIIVGGLTQSFQAVAKTYSIARELNEMYVVLSACPEMDRALDYASLSGSSNCYPINTFQAEGGSSNEITYEPDLLITDTGDLPSSDPLNVVPNSKAIDVSVDYFRGLGPALKLRMLVTRNGVAQQ